MASIQYDGPGIDEREPGIFFNHMKKIIVRLQVETLDGGIAIGTGCFINGGRHILTCGHLFDDIAPVRFWTWTERVLNCSAERINQEPYLTATLVRRDEAKDLALLKVDSNINFDYGVIETGSLHLWSTVHCISMANGKNFTYNCCKVSEVSKTAEELCLNWLGGLDEDTKVLEISGMAENTGGGSSGAPILNEKGQIVGIYVIQRGMLSYAITSEEIKIFLEQALR